MKRSELKQIIKEEIQKLNEVKPSKAFVGPADKKELTSQKSKIVNILKKYSDKAVHFKVISDDNKWKLNSLSMYAVIYPKDGFDADKKGISKQAIKDLTSKGYVSYFSDLKSNNDLGIGLTILPT